MPPARRRVTSVDVARAAGCSQAAVSLWLNGKAEGRLSAEWVERIAAAAHSLGYVPNRLARNLVGGVNHSVAVVFPNVRYQLFADLIEGIGDGTGPDWDLLLVNAGRIGGGEGDARAYHRVLSMSPAGVLLASPSQQDIDLITALGVPTVVLDAPQAPDGVGLVAFDLDEALAEVAERLLEDGHRAVGLVVAEERSTSLLGRSDAVRVALADAGLAIDPEPLKLMRHELDRSGAAVRAAVADWRARGVSATICMTDALACAVLREAQTGAFSVPDDLAVIGFGDFENASITAPALSTVQLPGEALGREGARLLIELIETGTASRSRIRTAFVPRASTVARG